MRISDNLVLREKLYDIQRSIESSQVEEMKRKLPNTPDHVLLNVVRAQRKFNK